MISIDFDSTTFWLIANRTRHVCSGAIFVWMWIWFLKLMYLCVHNIIYFQFSSFKSQRHTVHTKKNRFHGYNYYYFLQKVAFVGNMWHLFDTDSFNLHSICSASFRQIHINLQFCLNFAIEWRRKKRTN